MAAEGTREQLGKRTSSAASDFTLSAWRLHLNSFVLPYIESVRDDDGAPRKPRAVHLHRARLLLKDRDMDRQWTRLAAHANDAKPFGRQLIGPPDWRRCLTEFATALIYGHAVRLQTSQTELDAIVAAMRLLRAQVRLHPEAAGLAELWLRGRTRGEHSNYVRLNEIVLSESIELLSAAGIGAMLSSGPRTSLKGSRSDVNAVAFYLKYHVVNRWFDESHDEAIAKGIRVVRTDMKNSALITAANVRALLPI